MKMRTALHPFALFLLFIAIFPLHSLGIFEEDAGRHDWHFQTIGHPVQWAIQTLTEKQQQPAIFIGTDKGVVAKISESNGQIIWRNVFKEADSVSKLIINDNVLAALFTPHGASIGMDSLVVMDTQHGNILWSLDTFAASKTVDIMFVSKPFLAIIKDNTYISVRHAEREAVQWEVDILNHVNPNAEEVEKPSNYQRDRIEAFIRFLPYNSLKATSLFVLCKLYGQTTFYAAEIDISNGSVVHLEELASIEIPSIHIGDKDSVDFRSFQYIRNADFGGILLEGDLHQEFVVVGVDPNRHSVVTAQHELAIKENKRYRFSLSMNNLYATNLFVLTNFDTTLVVRFTFDDVEILKRLDGHWTFGPFYNVTRSKQKTQYKLNSRLLTATRTLGGYTSFRIYQTLPEALAAESIVASHCESCTIVNELVYAKSEGQIVSTIVSSSDSAITYYEGPHKLWVREEALSDVKSALFYDLPTLQYDPFIEFYSLGDLAKIVTGEVGLEHIWLSPFMKSIKYWFYSNWFQLKKNVQSTSMRLMHYLQNAPYTGEDISSQYKSKDPIHMTQLTTSEKLELLGIGLTDARTGEVSKINSEVVMPTAARADLGISKKSSLAWNFLILVLTERNQVFAIHAATSLILWKYHVDSAVTPMTYTASSYHPETMESIDVSMYLLGPPLQRLLLIKRSDLTKMISVLTWIDPLNGQVMQKKAIPTVPRHILPLYSMLPGRQRDGSNSNLQLLEAVIVVDPEMKGHIVHPFDLDVNVDLLRGETDFLNERFYLFEANLENEQITGYALNFNGTLDSFSTINWKVDFALANESILEWTQPLHSESSSVPVQIAGNGSLLYRYINPNILFVITVNKATQWFSEMESLYVLRDKLTLHCIDLIRGSIVYSEVLPIGASEPIKLTACDNFVVIHYWNSREMRYELRSLELFKTEKDEGPLNLILSSMHPQKLVRSTFDLKPPIAEGRTYAIPFGVKSMSVTSSRQGITQRSILLGMESHRLYSLPHFLINVRNPVVEGKLSKTDLLEGLIPFNGTLHIFLDNILSYNKKIYRIKSILSHASNLESTSLVFSHGLDLFFTISQPSKGYDMLAPNFNYYLVAVVVFSALIGLLYSSKLAKNKAFATYWR